MVKTDTSRLVLDASIALRWCFGDGGVAEIAKADTVLEAILDGAQVLVPPVWPLEVGNVIVRAEAAGALTRRRSVAIIIELRGMAITVSDCASHRALTDTLGIAALHGLTTYDGSYLELAAHKGMPLATLDEKLAQTARAAGISVL
ncbi:MAG: type II toxin-antitoxin system VapC family toxin [Burkholderiaceae bacterium]